LLKKGRPDKVVSRKGKARGRKLEELGCRSETPYTTEAETRAASNEKKAAQGEALEGESCGRGGL